MAQNFSFGLPDDLPSHPGLEAHVDHAPIRKQILSGKEERLPQKDFAPWTSIHP